jgi:hypothetical protein
MIEYRIVWINKKMSENRICQTVILKNVKTSEHFSEYWNFRILEY